MATEAKTAIASSRAIGRRAASWISSCSSESQGFIMRQAGSPASNRALEMIIELVHKQIR